MSSSFLSRTGAGSLFRGIGRGRPAQASEPAKPSADDGDEDAKRAAELDEREAALAERERAVAEREAEIDKREKALSDPDNDDDDDTDEEGDDDNDREEMSGAAGQRVMKARSRERARIATILSHASAKGNADYAAAVALESGLSRGKACAMLDRAPRVGALATRMAGEAQPRPGAGGPAPSAAQQVDRSWDAAFKAIGR